MQFNMKSGVLGIIVVCVILGMSILLVSALDVQEETREVTKYNYITDTTSLFDFEKSPQYNEYDLAKNYTGYYIESKKPYWSGIDFYDKSNQVNNYKLNLEPTAYTDTTKDLTLVTWNNSDPPGQLNQVSNFSVSVYGANGIDYGISSDNGYKVENRANKPNTVTISDLLTEYGLSDYTKVLLTPTSSSIADRLLFTSTEDYYLYHEEGAQKVWGHRYSMADMADTYTTYSMYFVNYNTSVACLSCVVDFTTEMVTLYSSPTVQDSSTFVRSVPLDKACIVFGGTAVHYTDVYTTTFGDSVHIVAQKLPPNEYLNIKAGVSISSTGA